MSRKRNNTLDVSSLPKAAGAVPRYALTGGASGKSSSLAWAPSPSARRLPLPPGVTEHDTYVEWIRVSGDKQGAMDTQEGQRGALGQMRQEFGGRFVEQLDEGVISATLGSADRPKLRRLKELSDAKAYRQLRTASLDRLVRQMDPRERWAVYGMVADAGAIIIDATGKVYDPSDPEAEERFYRDSRDAALEPGKILRRTMRGRRAWAAAGYLVRGGVPYGYISVVKDKRHVVVIVEERAAIVRQIFSWADQGLGIAVIARRLNDAGVPSPKGLRWLKCAVIKVLRTPSYTGALTQRIQGESYGRTPPVVESYTISIPTIVDRELWTRVQNVLTARRTSPPGRPAKVEALLRGLARCGICGRTMYVTTNFGDRYYACASKHDGVSCGNIGHPLAPVDDVFWRVVTERLRDPELLRGAVAANGTTTRADSWQQQIAGAEKLIARISREALGLNALRSSAESSLVTEEDARRRVEDLARRKANAERTIEIARQAIAAEASREARIHTMEEQIASLQAALDAPSFEARRTVIESLVSRGDITIHVDRTIEVRMDVGGPTGGGPAGGPAVPKLSRASTSSP